MAEVKVIVAGPARGAGHMPKVWTGPARTVGDVVTGAQPDEAGAPTGHGRVLCFVNGQDVRLAQGDDTVLADGDAVMLVHSATDL